MAQLKLSDNSILDLFFFGGWAIKDFKDFS
jgi:hypothetical protein